MIMIKPDSLQFRFKNLIVSDLGFLLIMFLILLDTKSLNSIAYYQGSILSFWLSAL